MWAVRYYKISEKNEFIESPATRVQRWRDTVGHSGFRVEFSPWCPRGLTGGVSFLSHWSVSNMIPDSATDMFVFLDLWGVTVHNKYWDHIRLAVGCSKVWETLYVTLFCRKLEINNIIHDVRVDLSVVSQKPEVCVSFGVVNKQLQYVLRETWGVTVVWAGIWYEKIWKSIYMSPSGIPWVTQWNVCR